jgi:hypothetical protein
MNAPQALPPGAVFATADVTSDQSIQADQPGYAVVASAGVESVKRVNPGDVFSAGSLVSMVFDTGVGMLINHLTKPAPPDSGTAGSAPPPVSATPPPVSATRPPVSATVGSTPLTEQDQPNPLPVNNGKATVFVGSTQPFETPAIATETVTRTPDTTYAVVLNNTGQKVGQLSDYSGLPANSNAVRIVTEDANGATLNQAKVAGGELNGTPTARFNKATYQAGESGTLELGNFDNYKKMVALTKFGGAANLTEQPIRLVPISDVTGLPAETPYGTTKLSFVTTNPGQAQVAVYFPESAPPKPVANPGSSDVLKQADTQFSTWLGQFSQ